MWAGSPKTPATRWTRRLTTGQPDPTICPNPIVHIRLYFATFSRGGTHDPQMPRFGARRLGLVRLRRPCLDVVEGACTPIEPPTLPSTTANQIVQTPDWSRMTSPVLRSEAPLQVVKREAELRLDRMAERNLWPKTCNIISQTPRFSWSSCIPFL